MLLKSFTLLFLLFSSSSYSSASSKEDASTKGQKLVVYTHRNAQLIQPLFDEYQKQTGIKIEFLTGEPGALIQRLVAEGPGTPADIFISVDAGTLWEAEKQGLFIPLKSKVLEEKVPSSLRDPQGSWFGLSLRARTIFYNQEKVKVSDLKDYHDLANEKWKGKLCLRSSKKVYNQSLISMLIAESGNKKTTETVKGWVNNLSIPVFENDTKLLEIISRGDCHVGIANTYYLGRLQKDGKAMNVGVYFPPQTHMNISGAGVLRHSQRKQEAQKFLEWLTTNTAQKLFADSNLEYPVVPGIQPDPIVVSWGEPKYSKQFPLIKAGELQQQAMKIIEQTKYQ